MVAPGSASAYPCRSSRRSSPSKENIREQVRKTFTVFDHLERQSIDRLSGIGPASAPVFRYGARHLPPILLAGSGDFASYFTGVWSLLTPHRACESPLRLPDHPAPRRSSPRGPEAVLHRAHAALLGRLGDRRPAVVGYWHGVDWTPNRVQQGVLPRSGASAPGRPTNELLDEGLPERVR